MGRPPTIPDTDRVFTLEEAAERAKCSTTKLRRAIRFGHLEALPRPTPKHHIRLRRHALDLWVLNGSDARKK